MPCFAVLPLFTAQDKCGRLVGAADPALVEGAADARTKQRREVPGAS
jgi:hypothetical protein